MNTEADWNSICPPLYRETNIEHKGLSRCARRIIEEWNLDVGLGFVGEVGRGKTRLMFLALRRAFNEQYEVDAISHNEFSRLVQRVFAGRNDFKVEQRFDGLKKVDFLFLDDVGKAPSTERADAEFEELIEHRIAHLLPTLWTANGASAWLERRLGPDRGPAVVRRLLQFSECVCVDEGWKPGERTPAFGRPVHRKIREMDFGSLRVKWHKFVTLKCPSLGDTTFYEAENKVRAEFVQWLDSDDQF